MAAATPDNPAAYTGGAATWTNATFAGRLVHTNPNPNFVSSTTVTSARQRPQRQRGGRPRQQPDLPQQRARRRPAGELLRRQSRTPTSSASATAARSAPIMRCRSSCGAACRTAWRSTAAISTRSRKAPSSSASTSAARRTPSTPASVTPSRRSGTGSSRSGNERASAPTGPRSLRRHRGRLAVQRRRPLPAAHHELRQRAAGRHDARRRRRSCISWDPRPDPQTGEIRVFALPDDVILNTRRAFSVSTTNPSGYSDLGVPEGRYFAPANSADCIQLKAGDCADRAVVLLDAVVHALRHRRDQERAARRQQEHRVPRRRAQRVRQRQLHGDRCVTHAGRRRGIFQTDTAYRDLDNTYDPGGRLGQLAIRFNW